MQIQDCSELVIDGNAMLLAWRLQLNLLEKQIRMLNDLMEAAPAVYREENWETGQEQGEFVVMHRQRMREVIEQMKRQIQIIKNSVIAVAEDNTGYQIEGILDGVS